MIEVRQRPEEGTATPENSCYWLARCTVDGQPYAARSRRGAPHELARLLVSAGIPDQPMRVYSAGLAGYATYPSIHKAALYTIRENASTPPTRVRWEPPPAEWPVKLSGDGQKGGSSPSDADQALAGLDPDQATAAPPPPTRSFEPRRIVIAADTD